MQNILKMYPSEVLAWTKASIRECHFFDHGAGLISGDVHTVEVSVAVKSLNLSNLELELSPVFSLGGVVAISK